MESPQRVNFEYQGVGIRFVATLIDFVVIFIVLMAAGYLFFDSVFESCNPLVGLQVGGEAVVEKCESIKNTSQIGFVTFVLLYYIALEGIFGATVGKLVTGLRIVKLDGSKIGIKEAVIRTVLRLVDGIFGYLVAAIVVWNSEKKQRLGDMAAGTAVVRKRPIVAQNPIPSQPSTQQGMDTGDTPKGV